MTDQEYLDRLIESDRRIREYTALIHAQASAERAAEQARLAKEREWMLLPFWPTTW